VILGNLFIAKDAEVFAEDAEDLYFLCGLCEVLSVLCG